MTAKTRTTDTEDSIRVTLTLRRETNPEWYARLINVANGRDRAAIVRSHLTIPKNFGVLTNPNQSVQNSKKEQPLTLIPENIESTSGYSSIESTAYTKNESVNYTEKKEINSSETVNYLEQKEINSSETVNYPEKKEINSFISNKNEPEKTGMNGLPEVSKAMKTQGNSSSLGMADMLLGKFGFDN